MKKQVLISKRDKLLKELDCINNEIKEIDNLKEIELYINDFNKNYLEQYELIIKHSNDLKMFTLNIKDSNTILMVIDSINSNNYDNELVELTKELHKIIKFKTDYLNLKNYLIKLNKEGKSKFTIEQCDYRTQNILIKENAEKQNYTYKINTETKDLTVKTTINIKNLKKLLNAEFDNSSRLTVTYKLQNDKSYYNKPKLEEEYELKFENTDLNKLPAYRKIMDKAISEYSYVLKLGGDKYESRY